MNTSRTACALLIGLAVLAAGCAEDSTAQKAEPRPQNVSAQDQRQILSEGYSLLYKELDDLSKLHLIFLVKSESQPVNDVTTAVTEYADSLKATLERVTRDYPAVNIKLEPLPVVEQRTRQAIGKDRVLSFAPVVGLTGESFNRRVLQTLEGTLNHLRYVAKTIADEEPEPSLKQIATTAHNKLDENYKTRSRHARRHVLRQYRRAESRDEGGPERHDEGGAMT
jgi:hypothetical protein